MLKPVAWFDNPKVLDCSVTPIPKNTDLPLQVIASLVKTVNEIHVIQSTEEYVGVYMGAVGEEVLVAIIGGLSMPPIEALIPIGARVSLRSEGTEDITVGSVCCQFLAYIRPPRY